MRLKNLFSLTALILNLLFFTTTAWSQQGPVLGPAMSVPLRVISAVDSEEGSLVHAVVDRAVTTPNGTVLIAANTPVEMIAEKHRSRGLGKPGTVRLVPVKTFAVDNQPILLQGGTEATGQSRKGLTWALAAGTFVAALTGGIIMMATGFSTDLDDDSGDALGAAGAGLMLISPISWFFLLMHGKPATIPAGTVMENVYPRQIYQINTGQ